MPGPGYIRIGELSRRSGVSPELLRAWERRYGLFEPDRSPGRFRLYSDADVARVQAMKDHLAQGLSAAQAARLVLEAPSREARRPDERGLVLDEPLLELRRALATFDEVGAQAALDRLLATLSLDAFLQGVVLPVLREIGESWVSGDSTIGQEHFATGILRGRLLALGRGWGRGGGPHALLAAPPAEQHDLGLIVLGLALRDRGWRVTFLGADTPIETIADTAQRVSPDAIVLSALVPSRLRPVLRAIAELAGEWRVFLAGASATAELAAEAGAQYLAEGPIEAAAVLGEAVRALRPRA